ncbi:bile acid:sodium symporter family protein [Octadecabacter sp. 1_MG-2023]|uniref:bile acid:sodium symporter family protein n=1 Tax=unclassified Octadecabacter TaxID=196158 RepID=UPI001C08DDBA|nr:MULTISPECIES: bile acid:sodium symporter family protein [unclassified Octadecabacter]MBU2994612.1 bile acid:sodium symporter family protein [Octadecabacter sp. B2R22]MDO6734095.1 bile acid:sodium symporter family protein [Octadecabacter sp. 1_MG-2023]
MDILVNVVLPLSLAIIMFSLGIGLTLADFHRVAERGWVFAVGALCQLVLLPVVAYLVILTFGLTGALAAGVMLIALCPGGVTSNVVTRLAKGDVALSVSLTALISLVSIFTVPVMIGWAVVHFMGEDAPEISVTTLALAMFLLTMLPVILGMVLRHFATPLADRIEPVLIKLASVLFVLIILAAIASNWTLLTENVAKLGPALLSLNVVTMLAGLLIAGALGLTWAERKTISIEVGIQNGSLGITLAPLIVGVSGGIPTIGLPSALYGVIMYVTAIPFVLWLRSRKS